MSAALGIALLAAAPAAGPTLGPIRLQLYYKATGTLSADLAGRNTSL